MTPTGYSGLAAALIGVASAAHAQGGFAMRQNHDGAYAVDITTTHGDCDKHSHWMILVSGGRVTSYGHTPMNASGHVYPHGNVHLRFTRFHHVATITGRLTAEAGSGTWHSPTMECTGSWHARRRG